MKLNRRHFATAAFSAVVALTACFAAAPASAQSVKVLKLSHQFPASSGEEGDFRDRLARKFAAEVEKRTNGSLKIEVYPNGSLVKTFSQFGALRKGQLEMSVLPLAYGGGEVPEVNLTLMPAMIQSYEQGMRWKDAPIGKELSRILEEKGIKIVAWIWQAGGIASRGEPIQAPDSARGMKIRGGSKEMDMAIKEAGGAVTNVPSNEIYNAMSTGVLDAALTSSTSLISFRLSETAKSVTTARDKSIWYMFEPMLMSMSTWGSLTPEQQKTVMEIGAELEPFAVKEAKADDQALADVFAKAGAKVVDMNEAQFAEWLEIAKKSAYKDFETRVKNGRQLLDMALSVR